MLGVTTSDPWIDERIGGGQPPIQSSIPKKQDIDGPRESTE